MNSTITACRARGWFAVLALAALPSISARVNAAPPVSMGVAGPDRWAVLCLGNTDFALGSSDVVGSVGNVGVGAGGNANVVKSSISGALIVHTGGSISTSDAAIYGGIQQDAAGDGLLDQAVLDGRAASTDADGLASTMPLITNIDNSTGVISGGPGVNVLHVTDVTLTGGSNLTLIAPPGGSFVINVSGTFHMADGSQIMLDGALTTSDVIFNATGAGKLVDVIKPGTTGRGIMIAPDRDFAMDQGTWVGEVLAGGSKMTEKSRATQDGGPTAARVASWGTIKARHR